MEEEEGTLNRGVAKKLVNNNIKYLYDLCNNKDLNVPALRSLFWTKCKLMEVRSGIHLPSHEYKLSTRCSRCFLARTGNCSVQIRPMKLQKYERKLASKIEKKNNKVLTGYQSKCWAKIKKKFPDGVGFGQNQKVFTCSFCNQQSTIRMLKPRKAEQKKIIKDKKKKDKVKKKKDKNCGLKAEAVLEASMKKGNVSKKKKSIGNRSIEKVGNDSKKSKTEDKVVIPVIDITDDSPQPKMKKRKISENDRMFATSDFISLKPQGTKFKLTKKPKKAPAVQTVETKAKKKRTKKGPKTISEKAKLELFLKNLV